MTGIDGGGEVAVRHVVGMDVDQRDSDGRSSDFPRR
jgi:hypothetical protein